MTTTERVIEARRLNPILSASKMAMDFGVSRERVRQILVRAKLDTRVPIPYKHLCPKCGKHLCHAGYCRKCRMSLVATTIVICDTCGKPKEIRLNAVGQREMRRYHHHFCNRHCFGKWVSQFGFKPGERHAPPASMVRGHKYDYAPVITMVNAGRSGVEIARAIGAGLSYTYTLIHHLRKIGVLHKGLRRGRAVK